MSISRIISRLAATAPNRVVATAGDVRLTAAELDRASNQWARTLRQHGVRQDSLVTVSLPNGLDFVVACAGVWKAGATPQPVSRGLTGDERSALERIARPALVIGVPPVDPSIPSLPPGRHPPDPVSDTTVPDAWANSWKAPTSSGSTGRPKVVVASAPALLDPDRPVSAFLPLGATQLVSGPMTHSAVFTYAFRGLMTGHSLVILPRFDERRWIDAVERHTVTWALLVPTMMHRLLRLPPEERGLARLRSLETVLHLGAPCAPGLKRAFLDWIGPRRVVEVYAGSESNGLTMIRGDEWLAHPGSAGRPVGGTEVRIRRGDGTATEPEETGEIWMRRAQPATYRYLGADSRRDDEGWDTLGDLGRLDADGYLYVLDRTDDVINRGGEKVYPVEIERVLEAHPAVRSAVAYGVPDAEFGQHAEAVADVADAEISESELLAYLAERLDAARCPTRVRVVRHPLRDDAGKVRRRAFAADPPVSA
ncbi:MAG TPA: AMP-binding protein [Amycolatopsis sp.]